MENVEQEPKSGCLFEEFQPDSDKRRHPVALAGEDWDSLLRDGSPCSSWGPRSFNRVKFRQGDAIWRETRLASAFGEEIRSPLKLVGNFQERT